MAKFWTEIKRAAAEKQAAEQKQKEKAKPAAKPAKQEVSDNG